MMKGEEPCRTWDGMKAVLQRHFGNGTPWDTKPIVCPSWDAYLPASRRSAPGINLHERKLSSGASYRMSMDAEYSSSPQKYKKNVADPHKCQLRRATIKAHQEPTQETDNSKQMDEDSQLLPKAIVPKSTVVLGNADFSFTSGLHSSTSSYDSQSEINIDDTDDASDGLSMMARDVHSDGTAVMVKGQRSNIFHAECQINDKVCKMIVDGGSFANVISSDLVNALSLSTRRLPTPRYMQWMNQNGTLKITHKARVKFPVGTYIDTVDFDVATLSACHLLSGRPWQFDLDATHGGVRIIRLCTRENQCLRVQ